MSVGNSVQARPRNSVAPSPFRLITHGTSRPILGVAIQEAQALTHHSDIYEARGGEASSGEGQGEEESSTKGRAGEDREPHREDQGPHHDERGPHHEERGPHHDERGPHHEERGHHEDRGH